MLEASENSDEGVLTIRPRRLVVLRCRCADTFLKIRTPVCRISDSRDAAWEPLHHASFRKFYRGKRNGIVFLLSFLLLSGVGACVRVWNGVDDVLCGVQAHKCPKGGLEPLSVESPILGKTPGNHYTMPAFENFTEGKARESCFSCPCCCCQVWARACVCGKVWMVFCAVFKRTNVQSEGSNPSL